MTETVLAALQQWSLLTGVVVAVGCVAWRVIVAPGAARVLAEARSSPLGAIEHSVASVGLVTALVVIGAWGLKMVVQVMGFRDPFVPLWEDVSFLLFETFWGTVWMAQGVTLPLLAIAFRQARNPSLPAGAEAGRAPARADPRRISLAWRVAAALVLVLTATLALSGHAMGVDAWRPLLVTVDAVHTLAAGTWIGSLGVILAVGRPGRPGGPDLELYAAQIRSFSPMAIVSVGALLSMGVVLAWTHLSALSDLWATSYGRVLSAKILLAGGVFAAGFWNWRRGIPALATREGARAVQRRAAWEVSMAVSVLLLTAVLVHSPKP